MTEFTVQVRVAALDFIGRNGMNKQTTCSFSFGKILTSIYTDCYYLNNKLYFVVILYKISSYNLNIFLMNSNSFMQVRVQKNYFFEFGKMFEFAALPQSKRFHV